MNICWLYRKGISWSVDTDAPTPGWVDRHRRQCPRCEQFYRTEKSISTGLFAREIVLPEAPPFLHSRIMATLEEGRREAFPTSTPMGRTRTVLLSAMSLALILGYCLWKLDTGKVAPRELRSANLDQIVTLPEAPDSHQLLAWTEKLDHPLESELDAVVSDAKVAFTSLTENFIPSQFASQRDF